MSNILNFTFNILNINLQKLFVRLNKGASRGDLVKAIHRHTGNIHAVKMIYTCQQGGYGQRMKILLAEELHRLKTLGHQNICIVERKYEHPNVTCKYTRYYTSISVLLLTRNFASSSITIPTRNISPETNREEGTIA